MTRRLVRFAVFVQQRMYAERGGGERGDVPGWVLVTLMSALIVAALWTFARDALTTLFDRAMNTVN